MTKYFCDRCGKETGERIDAAAFVVIPVDVNSLVPMTDRKELCHECIEDIKQYINKKV